MINKDFLKKRFSKSFDSYRQQAQVQNTMAQSLIELVKEHGQKYESILEIGAGEGLLTEYIKTRLRYKSLTINDLCPEAKIYASNIAAEAEFIQGDIETINLEEQYDLIIANAVFQWVEDLPGLLKKLKNALTANGLLVFSTFGPTNLKEVKELSGQGLDYYSLDMLKSIVTNEFRCLHSSEAHFKLVFPSAMDIIQHLSKSGTNAFSKPWSKTRLKNFCSEYEKSYPVDNGYILSYHAQYFLLQPY
jgi:malonyl-CoA O-methyltransferase